MSQPFPPLIGPIAPERNPPINPQYFQPSQFFISAISLGATTTVTTSVNNNYVLGQEVRLLIPNSYGSRALNEQTALVVNIPAPNQVTLNISSLGVDPFIAMPIQGTTKPQIVAVGDINTGPINIARTGDTTFIPGSFINISPL